MDTKDRQGAKTGGTTSMLVLLEEGIGTEYRCGGTIRRVLYACMCCIENYNVFIVVLNYGQSFISRDMEHNGRCWRGGMP